MTDSNELLQLALKIARQAGDLLVNRPASWDLTVKSTAIDIATQMDTASEKLIVESILLYVLMTELLAKKELHVQAKAESRG